MLNDFVFQLYERAGGEGVSLSLKHYFCHLISFFLSSYSPLVFLGFLKSSLHPNLSNFLPLWGTLSQLVECLT